MKKMPRKGFLIDKIHKGFVLACIAVTIYGTSILAFRGYHYYTKTLPEIEEKKLSDKKSLLAEGSSDNLKDVATILKA